MTTDDIYLFDTYALIEIIKGNKNFLPYITSKVITTKLNLFELYYYLLREFDEKTASTWLNKLEKFAIDFDKLVIGAAAKFKLANKSKKLSMTDCIDYVLAVRCGVKYLTGDSQFKDLPNVEFVV